MGHGVAEGGINAGSLLERAGWGNGGVSGSLQRVVGIGLDVIRR
ncbi:hypothetical protein [Eikenella sp. NML03-A-027]|nr:hypothetical protein [Eikenella sp. NML03-A-027]